jgi:hypothetical protein
MLPLSESGDNNYFTGIFRQSNAKAVAMRLTIATTSESRVEAVAQRLCLIAGPVTLIGFAIGAIPIGHFVPPFIAPGDTATQVAAQYAEHATRIRWGAMVAMISLSMLTPWGIAVAVQTRRFGGRSQTLSYLQIACAAISTTIIVFMCMFWAIPAFRPGDVPPDIVRALNDIAYFLIVWPYFPFTIWVLAVGLAVLLDSSKNPVFPRWVGYFSVWNAISYLPAGFMVFFHGGPIAWNGALALYIPLASFFTWMVIVTFYGFHNLSRAIDGPPS